MDVDLESFQRHQAAPSGRSAPQQPAVDVSLELDDLGNLEQHFYNQGYHDGYQHGTIHGLIDGRQLGREKGFELWEEVGFYEGFTSTWSRLISLPSTEGEGTRTRAAQSAQRLLALVARFPTTNPTPEPTPPGEEEHPDVLSDEHATVPLGEDMPALLARMRAQYRALCAALGVRPRMAVAGSAGEEMGRKLAF
ncbi:hypothetical protein DACRYDRAFT_111151 [Dacryopinax primogenitus]|uniref:Essential protein Yae1 N-terminal domain-containing protein n=1 Tax=Dacryopinax primogenitus (strain DJM 731) TaxID=1858805 RepID=M5FXG3_DACPD|nr:uncharacterized protein DACRYDRAFT_111151 [Dacryopinax primogenitus]EJT98176.1 hypothetical protein DACRYDRAFT_111151 [Dacryopinax primogenitus]